MMFRVFVTTLFCVVCANAQTDRRTPPVSGADAVAGAAVSQPADEASIVKEIPIYKLQGEKLEDLLGLPVPDVHFVFGGETKALTDLSSTVKEVLEDHWKQALTYFYNDEFRRPRSAREAYDRNIGWMRACDKTQLRLMQIEIAAPRGKRKISYNEATRTFAFVNRVAVDVVERFTQLKAKNLRAAL